MLLLHVTNLERCEDFSQGFTSAVTYFFMTQDYPFHQNLKDTIAQIKGFK
jgi:hypothetical protein